MRALAVPARLYLAAEEGEAAAHAVQADAGGGNGAVGRTGLDPLARIFDAEEKES